MNATFADFMRFTRNERRQFSGHQEYSKLSPEDVFLGACYCDHKRVLKALENQTNWSFKSVESTLNASGDDQLAPVFKVLGLQPRIAEKAFPIVYGKLFGDWNSLQLKDLNLLELRNMSLPWSLFPKPIFPPADWGSPNGITFDVKCNTTFPSRAHEGLRGLYIQKAESAHPDRVYPGFVFYHSDRRTCSWLYLGDLRLAASDGPFGKRVPPFYFRLPDQLRLSATGNDEMVDTIANNSTDRWLDIGWQFAGGKVRVTGVAPTSGLDQLLADFVKKTVLELDGSFLEVALWKTLTKQTLISCSQFDVEMTHGFLDLADDLLQSSALPVQLPRIQNRPLLSHWIRNVLRRFVDVWKDVRCPKCATSNSSKIQLRNMTMSSAGTIKGSVCCLHCSEETSDLTLLTHCHKCQQFPLIFGLHPTCPNHLCGGLVCDWIAGGSGKRCKSCKPNCTSGLTLNDTSFKDYDIGQSKAVIVGDVDPPFWS